MASQSLTIPHHTGCLVACGGLEPVAVAGDRQHGGVVETRLVGAAGVVLSKSSNSLKF